MGRAPTMTSCAATAMLAALPGSASRRLLAAIGLSAALSSGVGCTSMLGIDGNYTQRVEGAGSSGGHAAASNDASHAGTGGTGGTGGASNTGGKSAPDASPPDAKPAEPDITCRPGNYTGNFDGKHVKSVLGIPTLPLDVSGTLSWTLTGTGKVLTISSGVIKATVLGVMAPQSDAGIIDTITLSAEVNGTYDCKTQQVSATLSGQILLSQISGTLTGDLLGKADSRHWEEHEGPDPSTPNKGSGTWTVAFTGP